MKNTNSLNCVIVDDEPMAIEGLRRQLNSFDFLSLAATFHNPVEASNFLESNDVDLIFLDVNMPILSGVSMLQSLSRKPMVIFTTAHPKHALEAFRLDAIDYLLKPFSFESLLKAINKALLMSKTKSVTSDEEHTFIRSDGQFHRLNFKDIYYVEGMKDYVKVHSSGEVLSVAMNLSTIIEKLPKSDFIRVHKSFIVNKHQVTRLDNIELFIGDQSIPIGRAYKELLQEELLSKHVIKR